MARLGGVSGAKNSASARGEGFGVRPVERRLAAVLLAVWASWEVLLEVEAFEASAVVRRRLGAGPDLFLYPAPRVGTGLERALGIV